MMEKLEYKFTREEPGCYGEADRVKWFNESTFLKKETYDCPVCKDKKMIARLGPLGFPMMTPCECEIRNQKRRRYANALETSGLVKRFQNQTFENFQTPEPWMAEMKKTARIWAEGSTGWLLLSGQSGCGKTHLGLAACRYRLQHRGQVPLVVSWRDYFGSQSKIQDKEKALEKLRQAKECPLLYVDDFLKTGRNHWEILPWEQDMAFELVDYRYNEGLDTVISTEWTPEELREMDEAIASRIHHAAGRHTVQVPRDPKKNYRYRRQ